MTGNMIDYWITKREVADPERVLRGIRDIKRRHFDAILFFNTSLYDHADSAFVELMRLAAAECVRVGVKPLIHLRMYFDRGFLKKHPFATCKNLTQVVIPPGSPEFVHRLRYPGGCVFSQVVHACETGSGRRQELDPATIRWEIESTITHHRCAFTDRLKEVVLSGRKAAQKELLLYVKFESDTADIGHPAMRRYMTEVLDLYQGMPLAGLGWDEPGHHCSGIGCFETAAIVTSTGIETAFRRLTGDRLAPHLPGIFRRGVFPDAAASRIAYYTALRDSLYRAQLFFKRQAQRRFGRGCELGIHHTHAETESSDLLIGNIDYPKLSECLSSGYTDGTFFLGEISTLYVSCLAASLAHRSDSGDAISNLWCFRPREWSVEFHTRLLGLYHVNWFAIGYGEGSAVDFPHHHTWPLHGTYARRLREFNHCLDGAQRATQIGLIHTWQGLAAETSNYGVAHRVGMMRLTQTATRRNLGLYIAGIDALARGSVRGPQIILDGQFLDCLVVPWPFCLEPGACRVLEQYIAAGGRCILYGQRPGDCSPDDGVLRLLETHFGRGFIQPQRRTIAYEKEKLVGTGPFRDLSLLPTTEETEDRSAVRLRERCGTDSIELQYNPLASEQGEPLLYHQKRPIGVKAADRPFYYFSYEFPLYGVACASLLEALLPTAGHPAVPSHLYVQHYWQNETDLFAVCARTPEGSIAGEMEIAGRRVCLPDAKMAVITVAPGRPASVRAW